MGTHHTDTAEDRRLTGLVVQLAVELEIHETLVCDANAIEDFDLWRRAARIAGRRLKVPVRTGVSRDGLKVWAIQEPHLQKNAYTRGLPSSDVEAAQQISDLIFDDHDEPRGT